MPRTRPRVADPGELLLFVTEPQQLDALIEFGTETLTPDSIRVACPCGGEHDPDEHDSLAALDEDADRYEEV